MDSKSINIFVNDAGKNVARHGVFYRRELICGLGDEIPEDYLGKQVTVKFASGTLLECLGSEVPHLARDRV